MEYLSFFESALDARDPKFNLPLFGTFWERDIELRGGITLGHTHSSFRNALLAASGTDTAKGKPWISSRGSVMTVASTDTSLKQKPIRACGVTEQLGYVELEQASLSSTPIKDLLTEAIHRKYRESIEEQVYVGDAALGATGMINSPEVFVYSVDNGANNQPGFSGKTPDEKLRDINRLIEECLNNSNQKIYPTKILVPSSRFPELLKKNGESAESSILKYILENNLTTASTGMQLEIKPLPYLNTAGAGGTGRMLAYTQNREFLRFPMVPIRRLQTQWDAGNLRYIAPYVWALGEVEIIRPETMCYADGI